MSTDETFSALYFEYTDDQLPRNEVTITDSSRAGQRAQREAS